MTNEEAHRLAREKGVSRPLYRTVWLLVVPLFRVYFRMHVSGAQNVPREGAAIVTANHKSFWDSFFLGVCTGRQLRFMAKTELIQARYGRLLVRLGAFPVNRGEADSDAMDTAREVLRQGGLLALFPEARGSASPTSSAIQSAAPAASRSSAACQSCPLRSPAPRRSSQAASRSPSTCRWPSRSRSRSTSSRRGRRPPASSPSASCGPRSRTSFADCATVAA